MTEKGPSSAERWDRHYGASAAPLFGEAPNAYLRMICDRPDFAARRVLCLADGDGRNGAWLASRGMAVTALDVSPVATQKAQTLDRQRGVTVLRITADLADWQLPPGEAWDAVFLIYFQAPSKLRLRALALAVSALAPGGWLVVEGFAKAQALRPEMGPDDPDRLYGLAELRGGSTGLQVIEALNGAVLLEEGRRHRGEAEVVRFAARRPG